MPGCQTREENAADLAAESREGVRMQCDADGDETLCISTAGLNALLPCLVKVEHILALGFKPWAQVRAGSWWACSDVPRIINALQVKLGEVKVNL